MRKPDSLSIVLAVRVRAEEMEERALANACAEVFQAEGALHALEEEHARARANHAGNAGDVLYVADLQAREQHLQATKHACELSRSLLADKVRSREKQQAAYLEVRRNREVLDTLLKQRLRTEQIERRRRETNRMDDLFLSRRTSGSSHPVDSV